MVIALGEIVVVLPAPSVDVMVSSSMVVDSKPSVKVATSPLILPVSPAAVVEVICWLSISVMAPVPSSNEAVSPSMVATFAPCVEVIVSPLI